MWSWLKESRSMVVQCTYFLQCTSPGDREFYAFILWFLSDRSFSILINENVCIKLLYNVGYALSYHPFSLISFFMEELQFIYLLLLIYCSLMFKLRLSFVWAELAQLTGIAAILRFPLPDLEDIEMWSHQPLCSCFNIFFWWWSFCI
jgi:hypothetical protein